MEIRQELAQTVGFGIFRNVARHLVEYLLGLLLDHGKLEQERRVKHRVGIFLIGEDPSLLTSSYGWPAADSVGSRRSPVFMVADYASEESVVGGGYPVVVVDRDGGEGRYVDLELHAGVDTGRELRIETMDAFDEQDRVGIELDAVATVFARACGKIVVGKLDLAAVEESLEVGVELVEVECI